MRGRTATGTSGHRPEQGATLLVRNEPTPGSAPVLHTVLVSARTAPDAFVTARVVPVGGHHRGQSCTRVREERYLALDMDACPRTALLDCADVLHGHRPRPWTAAAGLLSRLLARYPGCAFAAVPTTRAGWWAGLSREGTLSFGVGEPSHGAPEVNGPLLAFCLYGWTTVWDAACPPGRQGPRGGAQVVRTAPVPWHCRPGRQPPARPARHGPRSAGGVPAPRRAG